MRSASRLTYELQALRVSLARKEEEQQHAEQVSARRSTATEARAVQVDSVELVAMEGEALRGNASVCLRRGARRATRWCGLSYRRRRRARAQLLRRTNRALKLALIT